MKTFQLFITCAAVLRDRNFVFVMMSAGSHFFPYFVPLNYLDILIIKKYCGQITQNQK